MIWNHTDISGKNEKFSEKDFLIILKNWNAHIKKLWGLSGRADGLDLFEYIKGDLSLIMGLQ